jgi:cardiolipin synthase (CMP-forming)
VSKLNTGAQILFAAGLIGGRALDLHSPAVESWAMLAVAALTALSGAAYGWAWLRHMAA